MPVELHRSRRVAVLAEMLRAEILRAGFDLPPGDSAARLVADKVEQIANQLGVSTRTVLASYLGEQDIRRLAQSIARQMGELSEVLEDAPPVAVGVRQGYWVQAAFGMCSALALHNLDHPEAMIVLKDAGDSTTHLAFAMMSTNDDPVKVGGMTLAIGRKVLLMTIDMIRTGQWACTCGEPHPTPADCPVTVRMTADLGILGGWIPNPSDTPPQPYL